MAYINGHKVNFSPKVEMQGSGNQDITTLDEYDVSMKATARVSAAERAKIIPANIVDGVTILGVSGSAPSENDVYGELLAEKFGSA